MSAILLEPTPQTEAAPVEQYQGNRPTLLVTAENGLLREAILFPQRDAGATALIIERVQEIAGLAGITPVLPATTVEELPTGTFYEGGVIYDWKIATAPQPVEAGIGSCLKLYAFILIDGPQIADASLFKSSHEAERYGIDACRARWSGENCFGEGASFEEIVERDADHDCSVYLLEVTAWTDEGL